MAALADPELARTLIEKMPTKADSGTMMAFSRSLKRSLILGPMAVGLPEGEGQASHCE